MTSTQNPAKELFNPHTRIHSHVLGFQVSMDNTRRVDVAQAAEHAVHNELNVLDSELVVGQNLPQIRVAELCHHVQVLQLGARCRLWRVHAHELQHMVVYAAGQVLCVFGEWRHSARENSVERNGEKKNNNGNQSNIY